MMSLTFGLFTQVSGSGPLGPLVDFLLASLSLNFFIQESIPKENNMVISGFKINSSKQQICHLKIQFATCQKSG